MAYRDTHPVRPKDGAAGQNENCPDDLSQRQSETKAVRSGGGSSLNEKYEIGNAGHEFGQRKNRPERFMRKGSVHPSKRVNECDHSQGQHGNVESGDNATLNTKTKSRIGDNADSFKQRQPDDSVHADRESFHPKPHKPPRSPGLRENKSILRPTKKTGNETIRTGSATLKEKKATLSPKQQTGNERIKIGSVTLREKKATLSPKQQSVNERIKTEESVHISKGHKSIVDDCDHSNSQSKPEEIVSRDSGASNQKQQSTMGGDEVLQNKSRSEGYRSTPRRSTFKPNEQHRKDNGNMSKRRNEDVRSGKFGGEPKHSETTNQQQRANQSGKELEDISQQLNRTEEFTNKDDTLLHGNQQNNIQNTVFTKSETFKTGEDIRISKEKRNRNGNNYISHRHSLSARSKNGNDVPIPPEQQSMEGDNNLSHRERHTAQGFKREVGDMVNTKDQSIKDDGNILRRQKRTEKCVGRRGRSAPLHRHQLSRSSININEYSKRQDRDKRIDGERSETLNHERQYERSNSVSLNSEQGRENDDVAFSQRRLGSRESQGLKQSQRSRNEDGGDSYRPSQTERLRRGRRAPLYGNGQTRHSVNDLSKYLRRSVGSKMEKGSSSNLEKQSRKSDDDLALRQCKTERQRLGSSHDDLSLVQRERQTDRHQQWKIREHFRDPKDAVDMENKEQLNSTRTQKGLHERKFYGNHTKPVYARRRDHRGTIEMHQESIASTVEIEPRYSKDNEETQRKIKDNLHDVKPCDQDSNKPNVWKNHTGNKEMRPASKSPRKNGAGLLAQIGDTCRFRQRITATVLKELCTKEASEIALTLAHSKTGLRESLNTCPIPLILHVVAKAYSSHSVNEALNTIYMTMKDKGFFQTIIGYFMTMVNGNEQLGEIQEEFIEAINDMIIIMEKLLVKSPNSIPEFIGIHTILQMVIDTLSVKSTIIDEELVKRFREFTAFKDRRLKYTIGANVRTKSDKREREKDIRGPPNDFREIEVFPQTADMQITDDLYLRANKVKGKYVDLNHYLDVQFRLLREDFIGPLRDGIAEFARVAHEPRKPNQQFQDLRIYDNVRIVGPCCSDSGIGYTLWFDVTRLRVEWESSKRLIFGSLVCLSSDVFETLYFATVVNSQPETLQNGFVQVRFETDHATVKQLLGKTFTMAETTAYFESYRHILAGLQNIRDLDLPFENYITQCENDVKPPAYLRHDTDAKMDLRPLVDDKYVIMDETRLKTQGRKVDGVKNQCFITGSEPAKSVTVLKRETWPSAELLHLDDSQYEAIHTALTREFVITQGPPGTGKTYIGLKIVKALLHNKNLWCTNDGEHALNPMLIVCHTNHALDQFLEGILKFFRGDILRVGGRSNSETLHPFNLKMFRQKFRQAKKVAEHIFRARELAREEMNDLSEQIGITCQMIQTTSTHIIHEHHLQPHIGRRHYNLLELQFRNILREKGVGRKGKTSIIVEWLVLGGLAALVEQQSDYEQGQFENEVNLSEDDNSEDQIANVSTAKTKRCPKSKLNKDVEGEEEKEVSKTERKILNGTALDVGKIDMKPNEIDEGLWEMQQKAKKKLKRQTQRNLASGDAMGEEEAEKIHDLWRLPLKQKWRLYLFWIRKYKEHLLNQVEGEQEEYDVVAARYKEAGMQEDKEIMRHATVIGMTTTGAARYQAILQDINPKIIVVEEAAEVLEAHIVTTLSKGCQHFILIGDHKQLKPNPTVYKLARDYNLDVSLFERMVSNGVRCDCLALQHRMRPEISELMKHIYPQLENHADVQEFESIKGVSCNMYFINHSRLESGDIDSKSHSNTHETEYVVSLCKYLLLQGYSASQITVLTTYSGQLRCLRKQMEKEDTFKDVKVTAVDNYQGEENDIVLLSLVRSNEEGKVGFLNVNNRVCVALSRAKKGFYAIGNFDMLAKKSDLWKKIKLDMIRNQRLGAGLALYCQNHPRTSIVAKTCHDFRKAPEGGCIRKCDYRLDCGHVCAMYCHVLDPEHVTYQCMEICYKIICDLGHRCPDECYKECNKCAIPLSKVVPGCGHTQQIPCHQDPKTFQCKVVVEKNWVCGHFANLECFKAENALCPEPCNSILNCEHMCVGTCGSCFGARLHLQCKHKCKRILVCGHECTDMCNFCPPCVEICNNGCVHSTCNKPCGEICTQCRMACEWECEHYKCSRMCYQPCDRPRCNEPCRKELPCGHTCIGLCGEECPNDCRECDKDKVTTILFGAEDEEDARFVVLQDCFNKCIVEYRAMDKFMDTQDEQGEIKLKCCPICSTPIRGNLRYGSLIKKTLAELEEVKFKVITNSKRLVLLENKVWMELRYLKESSRNKLERSFVNIEKTRSESTFVAVLNQVAVLKVIEKLKRDWQVANAKKFVHDISDLDTLYDWTMESRLCMTSQEIEDAQLELKRSKDHLKILSYEQAIKDGKKCLDTDMNSRVVTAKHMLTERGRYTEQRMAVVTKCITELKKVTTDIGVTEEGRLQIVSAMDFPKGQWFKCLKGHIYPIGDCGGAVMESTCPECKSRICGSGHRLRQDNQVASEMDGARYAAWSHQANLANYGFDIRF